MDFSSFNPRSSNSLNLAARYNDVENVKRLLKKTNPNCVDNRGWTCLHEAAAHQSYESLQLILAHPDCRPLAETFEGHTALYLAILKHYDTRTAKALLENVEDIANYASTEMVSPLHVASAQGSTEFVQLLLDYGAIIDVQDFDGDTPLHDAAFQTKHEVVAQLLHAGAQAELWNEALYTPLHLACFKGCMETVLALRPFINDVNICTGNGETPLMLATQNNALEVVKYLLENKADPHIKNEDGDIALKVALMHGSADIFKILLPVTDRDKINKDIILLACKPHYFNMDIVLCLLESDLGPEFFNITEDFHVTLEKIGGIQPSYSKNAPLNSFLHISEYICNHSLDLFEKMFFLFLMRGVAVDALYIDECPPLVYIHYCEHSKYFEEVFTILQQQGCDVDYHSVSGFPDAFIASIATGGATAPTMLRFSLACDPDQLMRFICEVHIIGRIVLLAQTQLVSMVDIHNEGLTVETIANFVPTLKHLCRLTIRSCLRNSGVKSSRRLPKVLELLPLPRAILAFLRYF
ncbi:hypothetical protein JYU34_013492 [Plutella xylostella]|uniref:SOCS box domain-containing protein n=1 Tax=Plutella xylostella TaxID=51655 RepID=A0ABQ7Q9X8_PLUXY|nr:hypothetical protein JYU34_013492 [Plutella xylostella]